MTYATLMVITTTRSKIIAREKHGIEGSVGFLRWIENMCIYLGGLSLFVLRSLYGGISGASIAEDEV